jgi:hypothetical protein
MNTQFSNQFFYLSDDTYYEFHDEHYCDCAQPQTSPHSVMVAQLYNLDVLGLQALDEALMGGDNDGFEKWLDFHNAQTYYGSDKQAAIAEALQQAAKDGKLVINHPEEFPWIFPLTSTLCGVVGDGAVSDGCLPKKVCECDSAHTREETLCRACYARLVSGVLHTFIYAYLRRGCQSEGDLN